MIEYAHGIFFAIADLKKIQLVKRNPTNKKTYA